MAVYNEPIGMTLWKRGHACVELEVGGRRIVIDPGAFTPGVVELLAGADVALITHDHFDHFDADAVTAALAANPGLHLYGPPNVTEPFAGTASAGDGRVTTVVGGESFEVPGSDIRIEVVGGEHAAIHPAIGVPRNVGYVVGERVYHPGDAYRAPGRPVHTLLVPVSGPWVKLGDAIEFIEEVAPTQTVQIHDMMLSEVGIGSAAMFLGEKGPAGVPMRVLETAQSLEIGGA